MAHRPKPGRAGPRRRTTSSLGGMRPGIALTAGELADVVGGVLTGDVAADGVIALGPQRLAIHSGQVEPGGVFVALAGRRDGHDFVAPAIANKAACAIVD